MERVLSPAPAQCRFRPWRGDGWAGARLILRAVGELPAAWLMGRWVMRICAFQGDWVGPGKRERQASDWLVVNWYGCRAGPPPMVDLAMGGGDGRAGARLILGR